MATQTKLYKPGDTVERSGIYRVVHDSNHTKPHDVTCVYGHKFPPCNHCGKHPRFEALRLAQHVEQNEHFK